MYLPDDLARAIDGGGGLESGDAPREKKWSIMHVGKYLKKNNSLPNP